MSGRGGRGQNAATGKAPAGGDGKTSATGLLKMIADMEKFLKDVGGLEEYDSLLATRNNLKQELEAKNREIAELKKEATDLCKQKDQEIARLEKEAKDEKGSWDRLINQLGSRYASWDEDKKRHADDSAEFSQLRSELETTKEAAEKAGHENRQLREERIISTKKLEKYEKEIADLEMRVEMGESSLKEKRAKLEKYRRNLYGLNDDLGLLPYQEPNLKGSLRELADRLHQLAWRYFGSGVPNPIASISVSQPALARIPLVPSNSPAACSIRAAFAEAAIAQVLLDHIFQDFYYLKDLVGIEGVAALVTALARLSKTNAFEASIIRCQLAKSCNKLKDAIEIPIRSAERICDMVGGWFGDDAARKQQFLEELKEIYSEAMSLWQHLQRVSKRVTAISDLNPDIWFEYDDRRREYDKPQPDSEQPIPAMAPMGPLAVLFPQIIADGAPLFAGFALFHSQSAVLAAVRELNSKQDAQMKPAQRRRTSNEVPKDSAEQRTQHNRRLSTSSSTAQRKSVVATSSDLSYIGGASSTHSSRSRPDPK